MAMFARLSDAQLLLLLKKYNERFRLAVASGKVPEATDIAQNLNAGYVLDEARRRGLVDEDGKAKK